MASRFETLLDQIKAAYAGAADTEWFFGSKHIYEHHNWNRIISWPGQGPVTSPDTGAQGVTTDAGGVDDIVWVRKPQLSISIWAKDVEQAENRMHAVLIALDDVLSQVDINISNLTETWVDAENSDHTSDGSTIVLAMNVAFNVLARDTDIVEWDAAESPPGDRPDVGDGGPTETVTQVTIKADNDEGEDIPPVVIT